MARCYSSDKSKNSLKHHGLLRSVVQLLTSPGVILQVVKSLLQDMIVISNKKPGHNLLWQGPFSSH